MPHQRMRIVATSLLCMFAVGYVIALSMGDVSVIIVRALEAGLIGGIADWFAVTALTRHPLGIRIPHTALLVTRKKDIAQSLATLVHTLLTSSTIRADIVNAIPTMIQSFAQSIVVPTSATRAHVSSLLHALTPVIRHGADALRTSWQQKPPPIDASVLVRILHSWIAHPDRVHMFGSWVMHMATHLPAMPRMLLQPLLDEEKVGAWVQHMLLRATRDPQTTSWEPHVHALLTHIIEHILKDTHAVADAWTRIVDQEDTYTTIAYIARALHLDEPRGSHIHITTNALLTHMLAHAQPWIERALLQHVAQVNDRTWIALIEQHIGRDIQWIRINGTVCGMLLGILFGCIEYFIM